MPTIPAARSNRRARTIPSTKQLPSGTKKIVGMFTAVADGDRYVFALSSNGHLYFSNGVSWDEVIGVDGRIFDVPASLNTSLEISTVTTASVGDLTIISTDRTHSHVLYRSNANEWKLVSTGLPSVSTLSGITREAGALGPFVWAYHFAYTFITSDGTTYKLTGPVTFYSNASTSLSGRISFTWAYSDYPTISDSRHYPGVMALEVYRTEPGGTALTKRGEDSGNATSNTLTFAESDNVASANQISLYTESGEVDDSTFFQKPGDTTITSNSVGWAIVNGNKLRQSKPSSLFSWPVEFETLLGQDRYAISSVGIYPVIFGPNTMDRVEGFFDSSGNGNTVVKSISSKVGTVHPMSIVKIDNKLYFAGETGFYVTDGFSVQKIPGDYLDSYEKFKTNNYNANTALYRICGSYDYYNDRVYWVNGVGDMWVLNLKPEFKGFTFLTHERFSFSAMVSVPSAYKGKMAFGSIDGYVLNHEETADRSVGELTYDVNESGNPLTIPFNLLTAPTDMGVLNKSKWTTKLYTSFEKLTSNVSADLSTISDQKEEKNLFPITHSSGAPGGYWTVKRNFPATALRSTYKQFRIKNAYKILFSHTDFGDVTLNSTLNSVLISAGSFPLTPGETPFGQFFHFNDGTTDQILQITSVSADTLLLSDPGNVLIDGVLSTWYIKGSPRNERIKLDAFEVEYDLLDADMDDEA